MKYEKRLRKTELGTEVKCVKCRQYWPPDFFHKSRGIPHSYCKSCNTEYQAKRRRALYKRIRHEVKEFIHAVKTGQQKLAGRHLDEGVRLESLLGKKRNAPQKQL